MLEGFQTGNFFFFGGFIIRIRTETTRQEPYNLEKKPINTWNLILRELRMMLFLISISIKKTFSLKRLRNVLKESH